MTKAYLDVTKDTEASNKGTLPPGIKIDGYNSQAAPIPAPAAAKFGVGTSTREGAAEAQDARRAHSSKLGGGR